MRIYQKKIGFGHIYCAVILLTVLAAAGWAEKTPFTISDSLKIKSFSPQSLTDDGRFIAGTISTRYDLESRQMEDLVKDKNLYRGLRMSKDGNKFFYSFSTGDLPDEYRMTDKDFTTHTTLTDLNAWAEERKLTRS